MFTVKLLFRLSSVGMAKRHLNNFNQFHNILNKSQNIIVITGAGVSAESGIPVFRGAGGLWRNFRATDLATPQAFRSNPSLVWEFYQYRRNVAFNAQPNNAHIALSKYEELCQKENRKFTVITQNVDGLHQKAGSKNVIELHGALRKTICKKCNLIEENFDNPICEALKDRGDPKTGGPPIEIENLPKCKTCKSLIRPYIVWFGENLDPKILEQVRTLVETCDLCLVVGTSSVVYPAASFAQLVAERNKPVAEFNIEEATETECDFYFCGPCGTTLPQALGISF